MKKLTPLELENNLGPDVNGVIHRVPWKAYDIDEANEYIRRLENQLWRALSAVHKAKRKHQEHLLEIFTLWEGRPAGKSTHDLIEKYRGYERKCLAMAERYK